MTGLAGTSNAGTPASRQKNCNNCVQAKRRCDRRTPICSRCAEKETPCIYYSKAKAANRLQAWRNEPTPFHDASSFSTPIYSPSSVPDLSFDLNCSGDLPHIFHPDIAIEPALQDSASGDDGSIDAIMQILGNDISSSSEQWLTRTEDEESVLPERPATPAGAEVILGWGKMASCSGIDPWLVHDPKSSIHYIVNRVKRFTEEMAAKNSTPFLHKYLYREHTPACIVSCFTTCVLYTNRTTSNATMTVKALLSSVQSLVDAEACRVVSTPMEKLARTQALFLYQIIRLFDGDIGLRAQGEKEMGLLKTWLKELVHHRDNLSDLALLEDSSIKEQPPVEWEKWIFAECVRRTVIIAYAVLSLYELLKDLNNSDAEDPWFYVHRWTLGRSLWEADSPTGFQRAWKDSPHFVIVNFMFEKFVKSGKGDDVDEFGEMLLNMYMGIDAMKDFMTPSNSGNVIQ
ncbi:hypothetical protein F4777DRAFT_596019 [Nemania sp. FL0916]|nr:hypothetical protein F4777DRAFT_596019 [Nemania sp. FL0916]